MKQKTKILTLALLSLLGTVIFSGKALAGIVAGSATVSWTAPTTNEGSAADANDLTDLSGYRIFYSTANLTADIAAWDGAADQAGRKASSLFTIAHVDVSEASTIKSTDTTKRGYTFSTTALLTPGQTYYFTVVAYDSSGNYSKCVNDGGLAITKMGSKLVYRAGNIKNSGLGSGVVGISDVSILAGNFNKGTGGANGTNNWCRIDGHADDIDGDCNVDISDLSILAGQWDL